MTGLIDKEELLAWFREIQATYMKSYNDPATPDIVKADMGHMAGMILAMGLEVKSGRFDASADNEDIRALLLKMSEEQEKNF